jgi:endo-1,4-beta-D-glucanase Y
MDPASISGAFTNVICPVNDTCNVTYNNELGEVILDINGPRSVSTPEGGEYGMLLACFASLAAAIKLGSRRRVVSA